MSPEEAALSPIWSLGPLGVLSIIGIEFTDAPWSEHRSSFTNRLPIDLGEYLDWIKNTEALDAVDLKLTKNLLGWIATKVSPA